MAFPANSLVKITGISARPELNDQVAKVVTQTTGTDGMPRYMLELQSSGARISLKPGNLTPVATPEGGGGGFGGMPGMPGGMPDMQQVMNNLPQWLREKIARGESPGVDDAKRLLGIQDVPSSFMYALAGLFVLLFLKASLLKAIIATAFLGFMLVASAGAFQRAGGGVAGAKASAGEAAARVRRMVLARAGYDLTESQSMLVLGACGVALVAWIAQPFFQSAAMAGGYGVGANDFDGEDDEYYSPSRSSASSSSAEISKQLQSAYSQGYEDGQGGAARRTMEYAAPKADPFPRKAFKPMAPMSAPPASSFMPNLGIGGIIQIGFLLKNIYSLGGQPFNPMMIIPNFMAQSSMQKGFMVLMVLRLAGMSPI